MKKDQEKTRLVERQEIYVDCTMLLKAVHSAIFDMPKKDRVISLNTYFGMLKKGNNRKILQLFKEKCLSYLGRFLVWNEKKSCLGLKKKVRCA
jgi:hypothetical protein